MAIIAEETFRTASWLRSGLRTSRCVGRIAYEEARGTGFLLAGDQLGGQFAGEPLLITANFVLDDHADSDPDVVFEGLFDEPGATAEVKIRDVLWSSTELHAAICLLDGTPGDVEGLRLAAGRPHIDESGGERVWVVGYPGGGNLAMAMEDNEAVQIDPPRIYYRAATRPGQSGSPIFNSYWEVVGLHAGFDPKEEHNYGVLLDVILDEARDALRLKKAPAPVKRVATDTTSERNRSFLSVFISYNSADVQFAERLYMKLQSLGVRCWWDKASMARGDLIDAGIQAGIKESDRVLLCCSESSLESSAWVDVELEQVFERERAVHKSTGSATSVVIPLDLDGFLFTWEGAKGPQLRKRSAADFTGWRDSRSFETGVENLMRALAD